MALTLLTLAMLFFCYCYQTREDSEERLYEYYKRNHSVEGGQSND